MDNIAVQLLIGIALMAFSAVVTFFSTKHNLKEYTNNKYNELKDKLHKQELELEKLRGRDENQQQIIDTFQSQVLNHLPALLEVATKIKKPKK